jgi:hypothetical protein
VQDIILGNDNILLYEFTMLFIVVLEFAYSTYITTTKKFTTHGIKRAFRRDSEGFPVAVPCRLPYRAGCGGRKR